MKKRGRVRDWTPRDGWGEQCYLSHYASDVPLGVMAAAWRSRGVNPQDWTSALGVPEMLSDGWLSIPPGSRLTMPLQSQAYQTHRAIAFLFKVDITGGSVASSSTLLTYNGISGSAGDRQPSVIITKASGSIAVAWRTSGADSCADVLADLGADPNVPHFLFAWREITTSGPRIKIRVDGKATVTITPTDPAVSPNGTGSLCTLGDPNNTTTAAPLFVREIHVLQGEDFPLDTIQRHEGYALRSVAGEGILPSDHPFKSAPPKLLSFPAPYLESTPTELAATLAYWNNSALMEQFQGTPIDMTGWSLVYGDDFTANTIYHDITGNPPISGGHVQGWFAPVHPDTVGAADVVKPGQAPLDTYSQAGSIVTVKLQETVPGNGIWKSGTFCSVNSNGWGNAWRHPYVEFKIRCTTPNAFAAWLAIWSKSLEEFFWRTRGHIERDFVEAYRSSRTQHHQAINYWQASQSTSGRNLLGRLKTHENESNITGLATTWPGKTAFYDAAYYTGGCMITPNWVIDYFEGLELMRFPTPVELKRKLWILVDLALLPSELGSAAGIYGLDIDYIRVYQNPAYPT